MDNELEASVGDLIEITIGNYEDERRKVYGSAVDGLDDAADLFLTGSSELLKPDPSGGVLRWTWEQARTLTQQLPVVRQRLEIAVAWEFAAGVEQKTDRCVELAELVLDARPNASVLRFLARLSRCYIAGFFPECVILCRALVENAIADKFNRHKIPFPANAEGVSSMRTRFAAARTLGWLSTEGSAAAMTIWQRGNTAVHNDPKATTDVIGTIQLTMKVLAELYA